MEGIKKARTMKSAEEFLSHAEERLMLLKIFGYTPKEDQIKDLCKIMEQFRKEGMEEAWNESLVNSTNIIRKSRMIGKNNIKVYSFQEWYNNQIKE